MPESPQVIVITPTLGRSPWLDQAVESVAARQSGRWGLVHLLVAPADQVGALADRYPGTTVMAEEREGGGLYGAVNYGAHRTKGWRWLTYLNDDDLLREGFDRLLGATDQEAADIIYGRVSYIDADGRNLGAFPVERRPRRILSLMIAGIPPFTQQGTLVGRDCFENLGGFDTDFQLAADHDFWVRAVLRGASFRFVPSEVGSFRLRPGQLSADQETVRKELGSIHARYFPPENRLTRLRIRTAFRIRHAHSILGRRIRTGHWTTGKSVWRVPE
ncbi:MAG: glycosyltransferase [Opitutaceae bacterium]